MKFDWVSGRRGERCGNVTLNLSVKKYFLLGYCGHISWHTCHFLFLSRRQGSHDDALGMLPVILERVLISHKGTNLLATLPSFSSRKVSKKVPSILKYPLWEKKTKTGGEIMWIDGDGGHWACCNHNSSKSFPRCMEEVLHVLGVSVAMFFLCVGKVKYMSVEIHMENYLSIEGWSKSEINCA